MNKGELIIKLNKIYSGDRSMLDFMIGYFDGLKELNSEFKNFNKKLIQEKSELISDKKELREENKKLKEAINKAIEYVSNKKAIINTDVIRIFDLFEINEQGYTNELLDILKEVSE